MSDLAAKLRELADDQALLWNVARAAIEDELVRWRDDGMFVLRNNGFVINFEDGTPNSIIRFGPEAGVRIALRAIADHLDTNGAVRPLPLHRTEAGYPNCSTCDGGGCLDCTDPA